MRSWILLPLSVALAVPTVFVVHRRADAAPATTEVRLAETLAALAERSASLEERGTELDRTLDALATRAVLVAPASRVDDREIEAAVDRWLAERGISAAELGPTEAPERTRADVATGVADLPMHQILEFLGTLGGNAAGAQTLFQELRDAGRMDEFIQTVEDLAEADPEDAGLQLLRGVAYIQKIMDVGNGPEAGVWANKADQAFDVALELDPRNWDARSTKAIALSNWPAWLGRTSEAIEHFEILITQQEEVDTEPRFAQSYLFLGNMYEQIGEKEKALDVWKQGLGRFPRDAALRRQVELAEN